MEEMCAFSALDNVRDMTCVSLLALGIQETTFQFCKTSQSKKTVQMHLQNQPKSGKKKKSKYKITPDLRFNEPFTFESSETQKEELMLTGSLSKVHAQLRRLKNDSSILKDASITAIPNHKSKVFFEYADVPRMSGLRTITPDQDDNIPGNEQVKLGFNMCECGFEGISVKVAKRSSNQDFDETEPDSVQIEDEVNNIEDTTEETTVEDKHNTTSSTDVQQGKRSTASGSVEFKNMWFNFAAPPKTPISRKIDFTKLDWNLLSTASPAIDAWLTPLDRLQNIVSNSLNTYHQRVGAVMASLMAEALDVAAENFLQLTKYDKTTALSKTLRDDPSCQLCSILVRYILKANNLLELESDLDWKGVPPLMTLRQGIVVLSRQWKNALYTPILIEYNLRSKSLKNIYNAHLDTNLSKMESGDEDSDEDEEDEFDDKALLLKNAINLNHHRFSNFSNNGKEADSICSDFSAALRSKFSPLTSQNYTKIPLEELVMLERSFGRRPSDKRDSLPSVNESKDSGSGGAGSDIITSGAENSSSPVKGEETLYDWMKRQTLNSASNAPMSQSGTVIKVDPEEEKLTIQIDETITSPTRGNDEDHHEKLDQETSPATTPQTKSMHLLDAHLIFEPLLSSLGLMPQQIQNLSLKNLGSNVSVLGSVDEFKIDIVESEFGGKSHHRKKTKRHHRPHHYVDTDTSPSFLCEKIYLQIDFKKVTDISMPSSKVVPLYISRAQLKRHTSSLVNFSIDIHYISQKVNMPLLRLMNQLLTMHENVKETNEELRERKPSKSNPEYMKHKKSSSGSSSSTSSNISVALRNSDSTFDTPTRPNNILPSPSLTLKSQLRNRPKSFAQKFRPNSRLAGMAGGYSNLESPVPEQQDSFVLTSAPLEKITEEQVTVRCWKTMYNLLELYSTMPTTKTVQRHSLTPNSTSGGVDTGILLRGGRRNVGVNQTSSIPSSTGGSGGGGPTSTKEAKTPGKQTKRLYLLFQSKEYAIYVESRKFHVRDFLE